MYLETDSPINLGSNGSNYNNGGLWGNDSWWIVMLLIFGWGAWGGNGFGGNGGGTNAEIQRGFDTQAITSKLNGLENGLCDGFYAVNTGMLNGFNGIQQSLCQGFGNLNTNLLQQGYETRLGLNGISNQISTCCSDLRSGQADIKYAMAKDTCDIIQSQNAGIQRIVDFLTCEKISSLQAENQTLKFQASQSAQNAFITANQEAQTAELIRRLGRDCPTPAYIVPNPNCCYSNTSFSNNGCFGCNN